jgi:beta-glucosidase
LFDPNLTVDERADWLAKNLTLSEKVSQMMMNAPGISRLNIPAYDWQNEALHGILGSDATIFPECIAMAASWDPEGVLKAFECVSDEGRAKYEAYIKRGDRKIDHGATFWAPNINLFRDPRWGRGQETYSEDPYLTSAMGRYVIQGLQGDKSLYRYDRLWQVPSILPCILVQKANSIK